ncbi:hypothetical protein BK796_18550 [Kosakonia pseudosacchari]|uniref:Uncharacterized protein n=1 Tax=Kosakonia pseudosacchari TaxID=1646340 RepID=A0ABX4INT5_9ENTR|nr:hypothetical protein BK796_18550 [Kosakonia pseudosacchari]
MEKDEAVDIILKVPFISYVIDFQLTGEISSIIFNNNRNALIHLYIQSLFRIKNINDENRRSKNILTGKFKKRINFT